MPRADSGDPILTLFDPNRDLNEQVGPGDWHPNPRWAELDAADSVLQRRQWFARFLLERSS